jgi:hypothetical protein
MPNIFTVQTDPLTGTYLELASDRRATLPYVRVYDLITSADPDASKHAIFTPSTRSAELVSHLLLGGSGDRIGSSTEWRGG